MLAQRFKKLCDLELQCRQVRFDYIPHELEIDAKVIVD